MKSRFAFRILNESHRNNSEQNLFVLSLALILLGIFLLHIGVNFYNDSLKLRLFLPLFFLLFLTFPVILLLRRLKYQGSYVPLIAMFMLMGIGLLVQTRMHIRMQALPQPAEISAESVIHSIAVEQDLPGAGRQYFTRGLRSQYLAYIIALACFLIVVTAFSGSRLEWIGKKFVLVYSVCIIVLTILIVLSHIFNNGQFLFFRTPWEPVKIMLPLAFAGFLAYNGRFFRLFDGTGFHFSYIGWFPFLLMTAAPLLLFTILGDLGQVLIYSMVILLLLFTASESIVYPAFILIVIVAFAQLISLIIPVLPEYVVARIELWHNFWAGFPSDEWWNRSYQTANAFFAVKAGGITGSGFGLGHPELVPLSVSDFVYAEIVEELGLVGSFAIILLYLSIILTGIHTAFHCSRRFDFLAITVLSLLMGFQVIINIGGVINVIPLTGIVLPFLSKGGFSLVTFSMIVGFIMAVSHKNEVEKSLAVKGVIDAV